MKQPLFEGVCTALVTPFDDSGINYPLLRQLIARQVEAGVSALVIAGTTGEGATLSQKEKLALFAEAVRCADGQIKIIAGTGSNDTVAATELSRQAARTGVDGLLCVTPYYNKCTQNGLVRHYMTIADAAGLPLILYNVPSRTGVSLAVEACEQLAAHPLIVGLKEADPDVGKLIRLHRSCGNTLPIYCGNDDRIVPFYAAGAVGAISVWSNLEPESAVRLCSLCQQGAYRKALTLQADRQPLIDALFRVVNPIPVKAAMAMLGYDCGPCRLPLDACPDWLTRQLATQITKT